MNLTEDCKNTEKNLLDSLKKHLISYETNTLRNVLKQMPTICAAVIKTKEEYFVRAKFNDKMIFSFYHKKSSNEKSSPFFNHV